MNITIEKDKVPFECVHHPPEVSWWIDLSELCRRYDVILTRGLFIIAPVSTLMSLDTLFLSIYNVHLDLTCPVPGWQFELTKIEYSLISTVWQKTWLGGVQKYIWGGRRPILWTLLSVSFSEEKICSRSPIYYFGFPSKHYEPEILVLEGARTPVSFTAENLNGFTYLTKIWN